MLKQIVERSIKNGPNANAPMAAERVSALRSGWRDLNSRPLDPQIGPIRLSSVNNCSLVTMVDR